MRRSVWIAGAVALGVALAGIGTTTLAARGSSGTYSLPSGNPVVAGTVISTTWANNTLSDISTELTDSLSRSGKGGMLAPLRTTDGSVTAPSFSFTSETGSGLYRAGAGDVRLSLLGSAAQTWTSTGTTIAGTGRVNGTFDAYGVTTLNSTLYVTGAATLSSTLEVTGAITNHADMGMSSHKITSLTDPTSAQDAATKAYVDAGSVSGFVSAVKCHHDGSTQATKGSVTASCAKTTTGTYEVTIAGLTTNGIVLCMAEAGTGVSVCTVAPGTGSATVYTFDGGSLADLTFGLLVVKL